MIDGATAQIGKVVKATRSSRVSARTLVLGVFLIAASSVALLALEQTGQWGLDLARTLVLVALGVGTSLVASGVVSLLVITHLDAGLDIARIVEGLRTTNQLTRSNQTITLRLTQGNRGVRIDSLHEFSLVANHVGTLRVPFTIYTDLSGDPEDPGGYDSIHDPEERLEGCALTKHLSVSSGKQIFVKEYEFVGGREYKFQLAKHANFRYVDDLVWTIESLSTDLLVTVHDATGLDGFDGKTPLVLKINSHRESEIVGGIQISNLSSTLTKYEVDFRGEVLPRQGFEVIWRYRRPGEPESS